MQKTAATSQSSTEFSRSQIANRIGFIIPRAEILARSDGPSEVIMELRSQSQAADARRTKTLYVELATCFHVAAYIRERPMRWSDFCVYCEHDEIAYVGDHKILYEMLKGYTGHDTDGLKKASRYNRALIDLFNSKKTSMDAFRALNAYSVDGLLKGCRPQSIPARDSLRKPLRITTMETVTGAVRANQRQTLVIQLKEKSRFTLSFSKI